MIMGGKPWRRKKFQFGMHKPKEHARVCSSGWVTTRSVHTVRAERGMVLGWGSTGTVCGASTETMNKEMLGSVETSRTVVFKLVPQGSQEGSWDCQE